jgi:hypothetical protein
MAEARIEKNLITRSLSGKDLSKDWPQLLTWEEHNQARGMLMGIEGMRKLSYQLSQGERTLVYLAVCRAEPEKPERLKEAEKQLNEEVNQSFNSDHPLLKPGLLPRFDGKSWTLDILLDEVKKVTGQNFNIEMDGRQLPRTSQMFIDEGEFRDEYIVRKIADYFAQYHKVMVIMGSGHSIREKRALEQFFNAQAVPLL